MVDAHKSPLVDFGLSATRPFSSPSLLHSIVIAVFFFGIGQMAWGEPAAPAKDNADSSDKPEVIICYRNHNPNHVPKGGGTSDPCSDGSFANSAFGKWNKSVVTWALSNDLETQNFLTTFPGAVPAVQKAFQGWTDVPDADLTFTQLLDGASEADVIVDFHNLDGPGGTVAQVASSFVGRLKKLWLIGSQRMTFDTSEPWAEPALADACPTPAGATEFDFESVAAHECGHIVGLAHVDDIALTLYKFISLGETYKRSLGNGDRLGAQKLY